MFKFCPFVHNVPNDHHRTANICNNITCTDMIAAFANSSIIYTPKCSVNYDRIPLFLAYIYVTEPFEMSLK